MPKGKFTEAELKERHVGKNLKKLMDTVRWDAKMSTYSTEGVANDFKKLALSIKMMIRDADGNYNNDLGNSVAQAMMDSFLIKRARDKDCDVPRDVVPVTGEPDGKKKKEEETGLIDPTVFKDKPLISENDKLLWVFENMKIAGIEPEDAPSAGAWALLMECRSDDSKRTDMYKTLWPKLLEKSTNEVKNKLQDDGKEVVQLIERLQEAMGFTDGNT